ncbi:helix-turn-helix domain-containing protein [Microcoleus sp. LAD1_D5]|uniref:helix-turn-helix domain-containing protein n=1 Tax=unclassified Microcoleus TaxID=2642155 RepID=UPI002FD1E5DB
MLHPAIQVRLYPTQNQQIQVASIFGCARWWSNYGLNKSIEVYKKTGEGIGCLGFNTLLPTPKKIDESGGLGEFYSQFLQFTPLKLTTTYKFFFDEFAGFYNFPFLDKKQSFQYPQDVKVVAGTKRFRYREITKPKINRYRLSEGEIYNSIISKKYSGKYLASILTEIQAKNPTIKEGRIAGIDCGNLVEIDRGVSTSKLCSNCFHQMTEMPLDMREGTCPHCASDRDREGNATIKIKAEGIKILKAEGSAVSALGGEVRPKLGRKSQLRHSPMSTEAPTIFGTTI